MATCFQFRLSSAAGRPKLCGSQTATELSPRSERSDSSNVHYFNFLSDRIRSRQTGAKGPMTKNAGISPRKAEPCRPFHDIVVGMQECWIDGLKARRQQIRRKWEALLRLDPSAGPLSDPDNLVHLIDWTLDEVLHEIQRRKTSRRDETPPSAIAALRSECHCGHNPLFNHFAAGEQALLEALIHVQADNPTVDPLNRSTAVTELYVAIRAIAKREFELLCSMCANHPRQKTNAPQPNVAVFA
jgi:hypothetical protein